MRGVGHACTNSVVLSTTKRSMSSNFVVASVYKRLSVVSSELNNPQRHEKIAAQRLGCGAASEVQNARALECRIMEKEMYSDQHERSAQQKVGTENLRSDKIARRQLGMHRGRE
jgi:hypothetical protein